MSDLTEFLLARIAEDEEWEVEHPHFGDGTARVRAECAARRRIVEDAQWIIDDDPFEIDSGAPSKAGAILASLAAVYADHPDYRQEWRP